MFKIDDYIIEKKIGEGAFSIVYLTSKIVKENKKYFASKVVSKDSLTELKELYFKREIDILFNIKHENIINLIEIKESQNYYFLIFEIVNGFDLYNLLLLYKEKYKKNLSELYVQHLVKQISNALCYLHKLNIMHRDLKLENILITFQDNDSKNNLNILKSNVKIIDFGFSKMHDVNEENVLNSRVGTPITMSPQLLKNVYYDFKTDIWSFGIIVFELLTYELPFFDKDIKNLSNLINKGDYYIKEEYQFSIETINFIDGLLKYDPEKRLDWNKIQKHPFLISKNFKPLNFSEINQSLLLKNSLKLNINSTLDLISEKKITNNFGDSIENIIKNPEINLIISNHIEHQDKRNFDLDYRFRSDFSSITNNNNRKIEVNFEKEERKSQDNFQVFFDCNVREQFSTSIIVEQSNFCNVIPSIINQELNFDIKHEESNLNNEIENNDFEKYKNKDALIDHYFNAFNTDYFNQFYGIYAPIYPAKNTDFIQFNF